MLRRNRIIEIYIGNTSAALKSRDWLYVFVIGLLLWWRRVTNTHTVTAYLYTVWYNIQTRWLPHIRNQWVSCIISSILIESEYEKCQLWSRNSWKAFSRFQQYGRIEFKHFLFVCNKNNVSDFQRRLILFWNGARKPGKIIQISMI